MENSELEKRITVLEDIEAIKKLKALYCDICDDDHNPGSYRHDFRGRWHLGRQGLRSGEGSHGELRKLFESFQDRISFSQHNVMNPIIEVNGDHAKGPWYFIGPVHLSQGQ